MGACLERAEIEMYRGDDEVVIVNVVDGDDNGIDVSQAQAAEFTINDPASGALVEKLILGAGISVAGSQFMVIFDASQSINWLLPRYRIWMRFLDAQGETHTIVEGQLLVHQTLWETELVL